MVTLDRHFVVTDTQVRRATRAAFIAWHHMPRPWRRYGTYVVGGLVVAWVSAGSTVLLVIPVVIIADVIVHYRATAHDTRTQEPVGTTIALGFGEDAFAYQTWTQSAEVPYSAVQKVISSNGCLVIVALSQHVFWALPSELIPPEAFSRMSHTPART
jgi:hypothetical protein